MKVFRLMAITLCLFTAITLYGCKKSDTATISPATTGEEITLDDGRTFRASFVREIRALDAPDLRVILDEQKDLYTEEEYAYIEEVMAERLGDIH